MNTSQFFSFVEVLAAEKDQRVKTLREALDKHVEATYGETVKQDPQATALRVGEDLVAIREETCRFDRVNHGKAPTNYRHLLGLLQDAVRRYGHALDGSVAAGFKAWIGVETQAEREVRVSAQLSRAFRRENRALVENIRGLIPEIAEATADKTVEKLRSSSQRTKAA